jgi:hypothetical protein
MPSPFGEGQTVPPKNRQHRDELQTNPTQTAHPFMSAHTIQLSFHESRAQAGSSQILALSVEYPSSLMIEMLQDIHP